MQPTKRRLHLTEVNPHLVCFLCGGYYIDATTIVECLHSFCRSCIIKYLEGNNFCPICEVQIHKARPLRNIKPDKALQDIVYKLVPGLYHKEMSRRREFYAKHPDHAASTRPEDRGVGLERMIYAPNENISLSLEYYDTDRERVELENKPHENRKRYLLCPALVTIGILKKFLRNKYDLTPAHKVEVFHKRECLSDDLSLMDVAYIYTWKRNGPIQFHYRFCEVRHEMDIEEEEVAEIASPEKTESLTQNLVKRDVCPEADPVLKSEPVPCVPERLPACIVKEEPSPRPATPITVNIQPALQVEEKKPEMCTADITKKITEDNSNTAEDTSVSVKDTETTTGTALIDAEETRSDSAVIKPEKDVIKTLKIPTDTKTEAADKKQSSDTSAETDKPVGNSGVEDKVQKDRTEQVNTSRISIGLLASLALERRPKTGLSISAARKRVSTENGVKSEDEKRPRLVPKPIPSLANLNSIANAIGISKSNKASAGKDGNMGKKHIQTGSNTDTLVRKDTVTFVNDNISITPVPPSKNDHPFAKAGEEQKVGNGPVKVTPKLQLMESVDRPKRPLSHMSAQQMMSPTKSGADQFHAKLSTIPRLIEINHASIPKTNAKKPRPTTKRMGKRLDGQKHDGIGALDLSASTRRPSQHTADILAIAQNLARRQQLLAQSSTPAPPLSPLSSLSAFPVPSFVPVRSPPPPLRIPIPPSSNSSFRLQHPHQQRPSSLSSSSPSPPADNVPSSSRNQRVTATPHDMFTPPGHLLPPPPPPNATLMFRSRFELQNPWHGEWYNEQFMRCLESLRRGDTHPPNPYFAFSGATNNNSNTNDNNNKSSSASSRK